jgi:hypothetical protein
MGKRFKIQKSGPRKVAPKKDRRRSFPFVQAGGSENKTRRRTIISDEESSIEQFEEYEEDDQDIYGALGYTKQSILKDLD